MAQCSTSKDSLSLAKIIYNPSFKAETRGREKPQPVPASTKPSRNSRTPGLVSASVYSAELMKPLWIWVFSNKNKKHFRNFSDKDKEFVASSFKYSGSVLAADAQWGAAGRRGARSVCVWQLPGTRGCCAGGGSGDWSDSYESQQIPQSLAMLIKAGAGRHMQSVRCALASIGVSKSRPSLSAHTQHHCLSVGASRKAVGKRRRSALGCALLVPQPC